MYTTRTRILLSFEKAPHGRVSGAALAKQLGMSRASIWKHIRFLRTDGFPIRGVNNGGYVSKPYDFSLLKGSHTLGIKYWRVHYAWTTASTQRLAKKAAEGQAPEGSIWIAEKQREGRGRLERVWDSGWGGLWFSVLLRPTLAPAEIPALPLVVALSLADSIKSMTGHPVRLKWPNDIVIWHCGRWKKIAGILTEMSAELDRTNWVVVGVGINVNNTLPGALAEQAVSLSDMSGHLIDRASLLRQFLNQFGGRYRRFEKFGFDAFRADYWESYSRPNQNVELRTAHGIVRGIATGVDARGALVVESKRQTRTIWEGEIVR